MRLGAQSPVKQPRKEEQKGAGTSRQATNPGTGGPQGTAGTSPRTGQVRLLFNLEPFFCLCTVLEGDLSEVAHAVGCTSLAGCPPAVALLPLSLTCPPLWTQARPAIEYVSGRRVCVHCTKPRRRRSRVRGQTVKLRFDLSENCLFTCPTPRRRSWFNIQYVGQAYVYLWVCTLSGTAAQGFLCYPFSQFSHLDLLVLHGLCLVFLLLLFLTSECRTGRRRTDMFLVAGTRGNLNRQFATDFSSVIYSAASPTWFGRSGSVQRDPLVQ